MSGIGVRLNRPGGGDARDAPPRRARPLRLTPGKARVTPPPGLQSDRDAERRPRAARSRARSARHRAAPPRRGGLPACRTERRAWARAPIAERIALARSMLLGIDRQRPRDGARGVRGEAHPGRRAGLGRRVARRLRRRAHPPAARRVALRHRAERNDTGRSLGETADGRVTETVFPASALDAALFFRTRAEVHYLEGVSRERVVGERARFYRRRITRGASAWSSARGTSTRSRPPTSPPSSSTRGRRASSR